MIQTGVCHMAGWVSFISTPLPGRALNGSDLCWTPVSSGETPPPPPPLYPKLNAIVMETLLCQALIFLGKAIIVLFPCRLCAPGCVPPNKVRIPVLSSLFYQRIGNSPTMLSVRWGSWFWLVCLPWIQIDLRWHSAEAKWSYCGRE